MSRLMKPLLDWRLVVPGLCGLLGCAAPSRPAALSPPSPAVGAAVASAPVAPSPAGRARAQVVQTATGLAVQLVPTPHAETVAVQLWLRAGSADDPEGAAGLSHLLERLLLEEQAGPLTSQLRAEGCEVSSLTAPDYVLFHVLAPARKAPAALALIGRILAPLTVDEAALERQRRAIARELADGQRVPAQRAQQQLLGAAFSRHPYRHAPSGSVETLPALQLPALHEHRARLFRPERLTLVVSGGFDEAGLREQARALGQGLLAAPESEPVRPVEPLQPGPRIVIAESPNPDESQLLVGFRTAPAGSPDAAALDLAAALLSNAGAAGSPARRREPPFEAHFLRGRDAGLLMLSAREAGDPIEALRTLLAPVFRLASQELAPAELVRVQSLVAADATLRKDTPTGLARRLGWFATLAVDEAAYEARQRALVPRELLQTLSRYLTPENLTVLALRPRGAPERHAEAATELSRRLELVISTSRLPRGTPGRARPEGSGLASATQRLRSGLRVAVYPDPSVPIVAAAVRWRGGLRLEDERTAGLHELLTRVYPRATRTRSPQALERELEAIAGRLTASVDRDSFGFAGEWLSSSAEQGLALLADCLLHAQLPEAELERERRSFIAAVSPPRTPSGSAGPESDGSSLATRLLRKALAARAPYPTEATPQSLAGLGRRQLAEALRRSYPISEATLVVVGDVQPAAVIERLEALLGSAPAAAASSPAAATPPSVRPAPAVVGSGSLAPRLFAVSRGGPGELAVGFPIPALSDAERAAAAVLAELLCGGSQKLQRELVERAGLALSAGGRLEQGLDGGELILWLSSSPSRLESAEVGLRDFLHRFVDQPLDESEVALARDRLVSRRAMQEQRRSDRALHAARALALGQEPRREPLEAVLPAVDATQVRQVARRLLKEENMIRAAVVPESLAPALAVRLLPQSKAAPLLAARPVAGAPSKPAARGERRPERAPAAKSRPKKR